MDLSVLENRVHEIEKAVQGLRDEILRLKMGGRPSYPDRQAVRNSRQLDIARKMRAARDAMAPLGISVKDLIEEGRER